MISYLKSIKRADILFLLFAFLFLSIQAQDKGKRVYVQTGTASFYNKKFDGRHTSSGERLDNSRYTAAHSSIPFGTMVRVTNQSNGKSVIVKINDRFYPKKGHIIDVTYSAAKEIDMVRQGMGRVKIEVLDISEAEAEAESIVPADSVTFRLPVGPIVYSVSKPLSERLIDIR